MTKARHLRARYRRIVRFAVRYIIQEWWFEVALPRLGLGTITRRSRSRRTRNIARHFHKVAIELGGLMIKVGQFLSSRLDVLPPEITSELEGLQDEVPPAEFSLVRQLAEADLGVSLSVAYASFDPAPIAAASLGQVHRARLSVADASLVGFEDVVVKIQRPGIDEIVGIDLAALRRIAGWLDRVKFISRRVHLNSLVEEFATISRQEIDYLHEGSSAERFAENFVNNDGVCAPTVVWERTTRRVLTLSDVMAIKISDRDALLAAGIAPELVAQALSSAMFDQLFTHGFFHADPHPGNIFVTPNLAKRVEAVSAARAWSLTFVDFGMMGEVPATLKGGLQRLVIAVAARDARGLVASIREMGMLLPAAEGAPLEQAMGELFARFGGMGFAELQNIDPREFADFAEKFGRTMRSMPFQLPESLLLIIRAVGVTSGVCTTLNPAFNIWSAIEPYAQRLAREEKTNAVRTLAQQLLTTAGQLARLPQELGDLTTLIQRGNLAIKTPGLDYRVREFERLARRTLSAVTFAGLLIGGIFLKQTDPEFGWALMAGSMLPLSYALLGGIFSRRR